MRYQQVKADELLAGEPLPWDVFDAGQQPLLHRGAVIGDPAQLASLLAQGLFRTAAPAEAVPRAVAGIAGNHPFSLIDRARQMLVRSCRGQAGYSDSIYRIGQLLRQACRIDKHAAIASVLVKPGPNYSIKHMVDTAIIVEIVMEGMGVPDEERLSMLAAALTMNIGMLDLQEAIHHQLGSLSPRQLEQIRMHPVISWQKLVEQGVTDPVWLEAVRHHHELLDGSGYPVQLSGEALSIGGRAVCIADVFSAWICPRGDRPNLIPNAAMREIFLLRGARFDADISAHLVKHIGIYPAGTLLQLKSGGIAVVIRQGESAQRPLASVIVDENEQRIETPLEQEIDISLARVLPAFRPLPGVNPEEVWNLPN